MKKNDAKIEDVKAFLDSLQSRIHFLNGIVIYEPRDKNIDFLTAMEWRPSDRDKWLMQLVPEDYYEGPYPNTDAFGDDVWVFGKLIKGQLCYIKIYFLESPNLYCISFHFAEFDMTFPLSGITIKKTYGNK